MSLLPIGRLVEADSNGVLPRIGRPPHPSWSLILSDLIRQFQEEFTDSDFTIALRGSVARGASVDEAADLDLVVLHDGKLSPIAELQSLEMPELSIETSYVNLKELRTAKKWVWMQFMLAHNGHTIFGSDPLLELPEPRIGPHCYAHLRNADRWLEDWKSYWNSDKDYHAICEWLMKRIVRSFFESQIVRINAFSRDIYPCTQVAMDAFPELRHSIYRAAELAVIPTADRDVVGEIVRHLSGTLLSEQAELKM
jgi:hypothetical protein